MEHHQQLLPLLYAAKLDLIAHKGAPWSSHLLGLKEASGPLFGNTHLCTKSSYQQEYDREFKVSPKNEVDLGRTLRI